MLEGAFADEVGHYERHSWLRLPAGAVHKPRTDAGCELYVKTGGHALLRAAGEDSP